MKVLALNPGSNSLKFEVVETGPEFGSFGRTLLRASYDDIGKERSAFRVFDGKRVVRREELEVSSYGQAAARALEWVNSDGGGLGAIARIGHRVVHGADLFAGAAVVNDESIAKIESLQDLAPLHNASALEVIRAVEERTQGRIPAVAVFDTVFHRGLPAVAASYGLPRDVAERHRIRRYGFHGLSHRYLMTRYAEMVGRAPEELRLAAIRGGVSVDTSMGFTPLEGLLMGTRSGDLDPAIVPYLMRKEGLDGAGVEAFLNKQCGLQGVSGVSGDTRELLPQMENPSVRLAIDLFAYRVRKYLGSYLAVLGGADAVVFGGGIGENAPEVRRRIGEGLEALGIVWDEERNQATVDCEGLISRPDSPIAVWVIPTEEARVVAQETAALSLA